MRAYMSRILIVTLFGSVMTACQDLEVVNENLPDTERALSQPPEVETVVKAAYTIWRAFGQGNISDFFNYYPVVSSEVASTTIMRQHQPSFEPRLTLRNDPVADEVWIPRSPWDRFHSALANSVDALHRIIDDGLRIRTSDGEGIPVADNTDRARIWGKLWAGVALGYAGLTFDKSPKYTWEMRLPSGYEAMLRFEVDNLRPYGEVVAEAVRLLELTITDIDESPPFTIPASWTVADPEITSVQLRQLANTMIARLLVYAARTPAERAAVNWQKVLTHTAQGLTFDFGPTMATGVLTNSVWARLQNNNGEQRAHPSVVGPADVSGAYKAWVATPREQRNRFDIVTPDRRITGATPTSRGAYFRYITSNAGQASDRGSYNFSAYQWYRYNGSSSTGQWRIASADENRLFRAEALIRIGGAANLQEAATLINTTRTRSVTIPGVAAPFPGLPAVTAAGVPESATCVPRTKTGACGSLMDALVYEREIELAGQDPMRFWMDRRGLGTLIPGTVIHLPIPARYLVSMELPLYEFGGVGGAGASQ